MSNSIPPIFNFDKVAAPKKTLAKPPKLKLGLTKKLGAKANVDQRRQDKVLREIAGQDLSKTDLQEITHYVSREEQDEINLDEYKITLADGTHITLDESQQRAVNGIIHQKYSVLIGSPGTGKTTCQKYIFPAVGETLSMIDPNLSRRGEGDDNEPLQPAIAACAYSGRATDVLRRHIPAKYAWAINTIHGTLGYYPEFYEEFDEDLGEVVTKRRFVPFFTNFNKMPYEAIVMDEGGNTPTWLFQQVLDASLDNCRFLIVGDIWQLPPVQGHSILGFAMAQWPTFALTEIHRQAKGDPIIENCHRVIKKQIPQPYPGKYDMIKICRKNEDGTTEELGGYDTRSFILAVVQKLYNKGQFDPFKDAIIVPQNVSPAGTRELNGRLANFFNQPKEVDGRVVNPRIAIRTGISTLLFAVGDKIMFTSNDNTKKTKDNPAGLRNGMIGKIISIYPNDGYQFKDGVNATHHEKDHTKLTLDDINFDDVKLPEEKDDTPQEEKNQRQASHVTEIDIDIGGQVIRVAFRTAGEYANIELAYAQTCHKLQGGQVRTAIFVTSSVMHHLLCQEWLITAMSRATDRNVHLYNDRGLLKCINTQRVPGNTLEEKIAKFIELETEGKGMTLPTPEELQF